MSRVVTGWKTVAVITTPGYASLVAVTSIWHWLEQEMDARSVDEGDELGVCKTVVGTTWVVM
jgi:hypothetical protein